ncbi:MAG: hypothetical protein GXP48_09430 [Acidobacteria bacterium]|nr:hypothetical protein [Acidobacteriota bacterium]
MKQWLLVCGVVMTLILAAAAVPAEASQGRLVVARSVRIDEPVKGDLVCIGSAVVLGPRAHVSGDVITVLGSVEREGGATVDGRMIKISSLAGLELSAVGARHPGRVVWGIRALIWGIWLLITSLVTLIWPVGVGRGVWITRHMRLRSLVVGLMAVITLVAGMVAAVAMGPAVGVPLGAALVLVFLAAKVFGVGILGTLLGRLIVLHGLHRRVPPSYETFVGVTLLVGMRLLPWIGGGVWALVSIWAVGAAVMTFALQHAVLPSLATSDGASHPA